MKRIFLDTNIILDFLIRSEYQEDTRELKKRCDLIITRNSKDFPYSKIPVMSVKEYLMV